MELAWEGVLSNFTNDNHKIRLNERVNDRQTSKKRNDEIINDHQIINDLQLWK